MFCPLNATYAFSVLAAFSALALSEAAFDYCSLNCEQRYPRKHTLCGDAYPAGGGPKCSEWKSGLSPEAKRALLAKHNEARQKIASGNEKGYPSAANMMVMTWHDECATVAQRWAEQCSLPDGDHDTCSRLQGGPAGQNLYWGTQHDNDTQVMENAVHLWYDEEAPQYMAEKLTVEQYQFSMNSGHFTQVAWALSTGLGCGLRKSEQAFGQAKYYLVCNYFPAGNIISSSIYSQGKPCSECQKGAKCSKKYPALCARPGDDDKLDGDGGGAGSCLASALLIVLCILLVQVQLG